MAAADVQLKRYRQARDPLRGQTAGPYADEANFYYITALRGLGEKDEYERLGRSFADSRTESPLRAGDAERPRHALHRRG